MQINWEQKWLTFDHLGQRILLHGHPPAEFELTVVELQLVQGQDSVAVPIEIQSMLDEFSEVFSAPTQLPPRRTCDHKVPLITGAQPVNVRPYVTLLS